MNPSRTKQGRPRARGEAHHSAGVPPSVFLASARSGLPLSKGPRSRGHSLRSRPGSQPSVRTLWSRTSTRTRTRNRTRTRTRTRSLRGPKSAHSVTRRVTLRTVRKPAEGRKFRNSFQDFFFSANGILKILRLSLVTAAVVCFIVSHAHEMFIAFTIQETCIVLLFVISYLVSFQHLLNCLHWPLLDLINSIISAIFLSVVGIMSVQEKGRRHLFYVGGTLSLTAAILCFVDTWMLTKKMRKTTEENAQAAESKRWENKTEPEERSAQKLPRAAGTGGTRMSVL